MTINLKTNLMDILANWSEAEIHGMNSIPIQNCFNAKALIRNFEISKLKKEQNENRY